VAEALGTEIIFPEHYEVANAVGTVVGNVMTRQTAEVFPCIEGSIVTGYFARLLSEQRKFPGYDQALEYARNTLCEYVAGQVKTAGAVQSEVTCEQKTLWEGMAQLTAWAVGKPD